MFKIVWKSFRSNLKNFMAFFTSVIMAVSDYNRIYGEHETLEPDEIISLRSNDEMWSMMEDYEQKLAQNVHMGRQQGVLHEAVCKKTIVEKSGTIERGPALF